MQNGQFERVDGFDADSKQHLFRDDNKHKIRKEIISPL